MQQAQIKMLFERLCAVFDRAYITVLGPSGHPALYQPSDAPLYLPGNVEELYYDRITAFYLQTMPIPGGWTILIKDQAPNRETAMERGRMAQSLLSMAIRRNDLSEQKDYTRNSMVLLANRLFHASSTEASAYLALWGLEIGFDPNLPRVACVFELPENLHSGTIMQDNIQRIIQNALSYYIPSDRDMSYNSFSGMSQDVVVPMSSSQIVLLKVIPRNCDNLRRELQPFLLQVCTSLHENLGLSVRVGVGTVPASITEYAESLAQAQSVLTFSSLFGVRRTVNFISDYAFELEISRLPQDVVEHFLGRSIRLLISTQLVDTVEALIRCNMDLHQTAQEMFVHRNTVVFRLNQIKRLLGLNPLHSDSDRFTLRMIYVCCKLYGKSLTKQHNGKT